MKSTTKEIKFYGTHGGQKCGILYKNGQYMAIPQDGYKMCDTLEQAQEYMTQCGLTEQTA